MKRRKQNKGPHQPPDLMRYRIVFSVTVVTCFLFVLFGLLNLLNGNKTVGYTEGLVGLSVLAFNLYFLRIKNRYKIPRTIVNAITIAMSLYLYQNGGFSGTGIFWLTVLPGLYISTGGLGKGSFWIALQLSLLALLYLLAQFQIIEIAYSGTQSLASLAVYIFSASIFYSYEINRNIYKKEITVLQGLLPICSYCKKIRDEEGQWHQMENYLNEEADIDFSQGICPECMSLHFPGFKKKK
jgi:hypothetical protein